MYKKGITKENFGWGKLRPCGPSSRRSIHVQVQPSGRVRANDVYTSYLNSLAYYYNYNLTPAQAADEARTKILEFNASSSLFGRDGIVARSPDGLVGIRWDDENNQFIHKRIELRSSHNFDELYSLIYGEDDGQ